MKNIFITGFIAVLVLISGQLIAQDCPPLEEQNCSRPTGLTAQVECPPTETGDIRTDYYNEIECRFTNNLINSANPNNPWLKWNDAGKGEFDCTGLLATIYDELTNDNFVILNDHDHYDALGKNKDLEFNSNDNGTVRNRSHWPREYFDYASHSAHIPGKQFFLLTPGDYRDYENLLIYNGGTNDDKKYLLYYDGPTGDNVCKCDVYDYFYDNLCMPNYNPINQPEQERAIIERFYMKEITDPENGTEIPDGNWVISGITMRGNHYSYPDDARQPQPQIQTGGMFNEIRGTGGNVIKSCLFENLTGARYVDAQGQTHQYGGYYIYMVNSDDNIITGCTFRKKNECIDASYSEIDMIGVFMQGGNNPSSGNMIFDNDMKDVGDAIQLMPSSFCEEEDSSRETTGLPGTLIYNNRLYNDKFYDKPIPIIDDGVYHGDYDCTYERMNGEGAIDLKMGAGAELWGEGTDPLQINEKVIIANNTISGWRGSKTMYDGVYGGNGDAIHIHKNTKNIVIIDNEITDCTIGVSVSGSVDDLCDDDSITNNSVVEHIEIYDNKICSLYPTVSQYTTTCLEDKVKSVGIWLGSDLGIKVIGNDINNSVHGIWAEGNGKLAIMTDNNITNIYNEDFYHADVTHHFLHFKRNTYQDFTTVCAGSSNYIPSYVIEDNYFLDCCDNRMGIDSFSCTEDCD